MQYISLSHWSWVEQPLSGVAAASVAEGGLHWSAQLNSPARASMKTMHPKKSPAPFKATREHRGQRPAMGLRCGTNSVVASTARK